MKKYATSLFAVLAAIMILFAGCTAPSGESGTANADTTQSTVQTQRQSDGGVTLSNDSTKSFDYAPCLNLMTSLMLKSTAMCRISPKVS